MIFEYSHNRILESVVSEAFVDSINTVLMPKLEDIYSDSIREILMYEDFLADRLVEEGYCYYPLSITTASGTHRRWIRWSVSSKKNFIDANPYAYVGGEPLELSLAESVPEEFLALVEPRALTYDKRGVKICVDTTGEPVELVGRYSQSFIDEMSRQLTLAIGRAMGVEGLESSTLRLCLSFAPFTFMEHTSDNVTYRRLILNDKGCQPRDFWVKWTRLDSAEGYTVSDTPAPGSILFEIGEGVPQKIREKEYRYLARTDVNKYQAAMGKRTATEWRSLVKRAIKNGDLVRVSTDLEIASHADILAQKLHAIALSTEAATEPTATEIPTEIVTEPAVVEIPIMTEPAVAEIPFAENFVDTTEPEDTTGKMAEATEELATTETTTPMVEDEFESELAEMLRRVLGDKADKKPNFDMLRGIEFDEGEEMGFDFGRTAGDIFATAGTATEDELASTEQTTEDTYTEDTVAEEITESLVIEEGATDEPAEDDIFGTDEAEEPKTEDDIFDTEESTTEQRPPKATPLYGIIPDDEYPTYSPSDDFFGDDYTPPAHTEYVKTLEEERIEEEVRRRLQIEADARARAEQEAERLRAERERLQREYEELLRQMEAAKLAEQEAIRQEKLREQQRLAEIRAERERQERERVLRAEREREEESERIRVAEAARIALEEQRKIEEERARLESERQAVLLAERERLAKEEAERREAERRMEEERRMVEEQARAQTVRTKAPEDELITRHAKILFRRNIDMNIIKRIKEIVEATLISEGKQTLKIHMKAYSTDSYTINLDITLPSTESDLVITLIKAVGNGGLGVTKITLE